MAVVRTSHPVFYVMCIMASQWLLTWLVVADRGLGKDIWSLPFDNITYILYVSEE
jgi:hypothetical protein